LPIAKNIHCASMAGLKIAKDGKLIEVREFSLFARERHLETFCWD
jgi:hypothetical protein